MNTRQQAIDLQRVKISCSECNLSELCLPRGVHREDLPMLDQVSQHSRPLHRGDYVFQGGDAFNSIFIVRSGIIKQYQNTDRGEERILGFHLPGELLGLDAIDSGRHNCTAMAIDTSSVCAFPFERLQEACNRIRGLHRELSRLMSREISAENELLLLLKNKTAEERIASFLLNLSSRYRRLGYSGYEFNLPMSREEIGNYLGLTTETVSRLISKMQRDGILESSRRFMIIRELPQLQRLAGDGHSDQQQSSAASR